MSHEFAKLSKEQKELMFEGIAMMQVLYDVAGEGPISHNNFTPHAAKGGDIARYDLVTGWLERAGFLTVGQLTVQLTNRGLDVVRATKA